MHSLKIKRIYEDPSNDDGERILVDRLWPRGVSKERAHLDECLNVVALCPDLRIWFDHRAASLSECSNMYERALQSQEV